MEENHAHWSEDGGFTEETQSGLEVEKRSIVRVLETLWMDFIRYNNGDEIVCCHHN